MKIKQFNPRVRTSSKHRALAISGVIVFSAALAHTTQAAVITDTALADVQVSGAGGTVTAFTSTTLTPNNDNHTPTVPDPENLNTITLSEAFVLANPAYIDVVFNVSNSSGVTEYFVSKQVANLLNSSLPGLVIQLGTGSGDDFQLASAGSGLDFDFPDADPAPFSLLFSDIDHQSNQITATGGLLLPGLANATNVTFSIDVPDNLPNNQFTVREYLLPVPEPSSCGLLLFGSSVMLLRRSRRAAR